MLLSLLSGDDDFFDRRFTGTSDDQDSAGDFPRHNPFSSVPGKGGGDSRHATFWKCATEWSRNKQLLIEALNRPLHYTARCDWVGSLNQVLKKELLRFPPIWPLILAAVIVVLLIVAELLSKKMSHEDPISQWIAELRDKDDNAAARLWTHFVQRLSEAARHMLNPRTRRAYDENDAAQSAFNSVFAGIASGNYPNLHDRDSLWRLLLVITSRKVTHRHRHDQQQKRDVRRTLFDSVFANGSFEETQGRIEQLPCREPSPEFAVAFSETCDALFASLPDPKLQQVAAMRLEGHTDAEIATDLGCARSTVQRRLEMIRRCWKHLDESGESL